MTTRTRFIVLVASLASVVALASGCASARTGSGGSKPAPVDTSGCPTSLTITATDSAKTVCVAVGGTVTLDLATNGGGKWMPIDISGTSLNPASPPSPSATGLTAIYTAKSTGSTSMTTTRRACAPSPGTISCNAIISWKVTVQVK